MHFRNCCFLIVSLILLSCSAEKKTEIKTTTKQNTAHSPRKKQLSNELKINLVDTVLFYESDFNSKIRVLIKRTKSKNYLGTLILLHGWNHSPEHWTNNMQFVIQALKNGYDVVLPDFGKSMYALNRFKETRMDLATTATRSWMNNTLIKSLFKTHLRNKNDKVYLIGISTGARGAVLLAQDNIFSFKGIVAISGDYCPQTMQNDKLMTAYYGSYTKYKDRWLNNDNPQRNIQLTKTPTLLIHGKQDFVVPFNQSKELFLEAQKKGLRNITYFEDPAGKHDFKSWDQYSEMIFKFLLSYRSQ
jgi:pimeloyl-ACP methyl ester carboxylesterase